MFQNGHVDRQRQETEQFGKFAPVTDGIFAERLRGLRLQRGDGFFHCVELLRQKLEHQHVNLIAEERFDAAFGSQPDGHRQNVTLGRAAKLLVQAMQFQCRNNCVKLRVAENAAKARTVGADAGGFFDRKFFDTILKFARRIRLASAYRARLVFAKLVELRDRFFHQLQSLRPFCWRARRLWIGFRQDNCFIADCGEKMFGGGCVHKRVRPGENQIHPRVVAFDEVEAHKFAALDVKRLVKKFLAQIWCVLMNTNGNFIFDATWNFPFWFEYSADSRIELRKFILQRSETTLQNFR